MKYCGNLNFNRIIFISSPSCNVTETNKQTTVAVPFQPLVRLLAIIITEKSDTLEINWIFIDCVVIANDKWANLWAMLFILDCSTMDMWGNWICKYFNVAKYQYFNYEHFLLVVNYSYYDVQCTLHTHSPFHFSFSFSLIMKNNEGMTKGWHDDIHNHIKVPIVS